VSVWYAARPRAYVLYTGNPMQVARLLHVGSVRGGQVVEEVAMRERPRHAAVRRCYGNERQVVVRQPEYR